MIKPTPEPADEKHVVRDMMGLLALPAMWAERDGETILQIMTEAIECIVPLRFSYVHVKLLPE